MLTNLSIAENLTGTREPGIAVKRRVRAVRWPSNPHQPDVTRFGTPPVPRPVIRRKIRLEIVDRAWLNLDLYGAAQPRPNVSDRAWLHLDLHGYQFWRGGSLSISDRGWLNLDLLGHHEFQPLEVSDRGWLNLDLVRGDHRPKPQVSDKAWQNLDLRGGSHNHVARLQDKAWLHVMLPVRVNITEKANLNIGLPPTNVRSRAARDRAYLDLDLMSGHYVARTEISDHGQLGIDLAGRYVVHLVLEEDRAVSSITIYGSNLHIDNAVLSDKAALSITLQSGDYQPQPLLLSDSAQANLDLAGGDNAPRPVFEDRAQSSVDVGGSYSVGFVVAEVSDAATLGLTQAGGLSEFPCARTNTYISINADVGDTSPYPALFCVPDRHLTVETITMRLERMQHPFPSDITVVLTHTSDDGTEHTYGLMFTQCGAGNPVYEITIALDDAAGAFLPDASEITSGTYLPTRPGSSNNIFIPLSSPLTGQNTNDFTLGFSEFMGINPHGIWKLWVYDSVSLDGGYIYSAVLTINGTDYPLGLRWAKVSDSATSGVATGDGDYA